MQAEVRTVLELVAARFDGMRLPQHLELLHHSTSLRTLGSAHGNDSVTKVGFTPVLLLLCYFFLTNFVDSKTFHGNARRRRRRESREKEGDAAPLLRLPRVLSCKARVGVSFFSCDGDTHSLCDRCSAHYLTLFIASEQGRSVLGVTRKTDSQAPSKDRNAARRPTR